jgi:hypothetical protein
LTARILTLHSRRQKPPGQVGPVATALEHPAVLDGGDDDPLLAVRAVFPALA